MIGVVGLGLIGGSIARRVRPDLGGVTDVDTDTVEAARKEGLPVRESVGEVLQSCSTVFVAVPLPEVEGVFAEIAHASPDHPVVVSDTGSVKTGPLEAARAAGLASRRCTYVGGHPMAGSERGGFEASSAELLESAAWALVLEPDTDLAGFVGLTALITAGMGGRVVPVGAADHDAAVARISHMPHLLAAAAVLTAGRATDSLAGALAASSFRDATRVAATPPGRAAEMCWANRAHLHGALADLSAVLARLDGAVEGAGPGALREALLEASELHDALLRPAPQSVSLREIDLADAATARNALLDLGGRGGCVVRAEASPGDRWTLTCRAPSLPPPA